MYLEVYPDIVFLINFSIDLILILLVKKVNKKRSSNLRIILASAMGAICAAIVSINPWMNPLLRFIWMYIVASLLMVFIAFGKIKPSDMLKQWIVLNLITYFVGGFMNSVYYHTKLRILLIRIGKGNIFSNVSVSYVIFSISIIAIITLFMIWLLRLYQVHKPLIYDVELIIEDRHVRTKGLMDTGNCLYDPIRGKPVMLIENEMIDELLTDKIKEDMETAISYMNGKSEDMFRQQADDSMLRFSFIPYRSVGGSGMLLGFRLDKVMIHTDKECICNEGVTAAICDSGLISGKKDYHVILHKELL